MNVYPPGGMDLENTGIVDAWVKRNVSDHKFVAKIRERIGNMGWFMKALKEPLSRMANKEDGCKGAFWQGRYKSIAILDEEALLATCVYIDLNPLAAGMASTPETSKHTSFRQRIQHARQKNALERLKEARHGTHKGSVAARGIEQDHWLTPIEDRRSHASAKEEREGLIETFSLGSYMLLVDYTARLFRNNKANMAQGTKEIFDRLGTQSEFWGDRILKMLKSIDLRGTFFAGQSENLSAVKDKLNHRVANLSPQLADS